MYGTLFFALLKLDADAKPEASATADCFVIGLPHYIVWHIRVETY